MKRLGERAAVVAAIASFFESRDFLRVETPTIVPSPGMDAHLDAFGVDLGAQGRRFLATSPEYQMKRLLADGYPRIYQLCKAYRRDEEGHLHNPEFSMLEWYRASASVQDVMGDTEQLVARVTGGEVRVNGAVICTLPPFPRVSVVEAYARFAQSDERETLAMAEHDEDRFYRLLIDKVEPGLATLGSAVFLTDYPACMASLARKKPSDPRVAERFELYAAGVELCNGFGELVDPVEQRARFEADQLARSARGAEVYPIDEKLLDALGKIESAAGNALGIDRLVMLACGADAIGAVTAFGWGEL